MVNNAERMAVGEVQIKIASLDDWIQIKEHIGRPNDRESLVHLREIKHLRKHGED